MDLGLHEPCFFSYQIIMFAGKDIRLCEYIKDEFWYFHINGIRYTKTQLGFDVVLIIKISDF